MKFDPNYEHADLARWQVAAIALVLLGAVIGLMVWANSLSATRGIVGSPGMFPHRGPITSIDELVDESAVANLRARQVVLTDVIVREVVGEQVWLVGHRDHGVPVVLLGELTDRQPGRAVEARAGQRVHVFGVVRLVRADVIDQLDMLEPRAAELLRAHRLYVSALWVSPRTEVAPHTAQKVPRVITNVAQLKEVADPELLQARDAVLDGVRVVHVFGDYTFLVEEDGATAVVALLGELTERQDERQTVIRAGDVIRVYGIVRRLRDVRTIEDMLMVSKADARRLVGHAVYVSALRVVQLEASS